MPQQASLGVGILQGIPQPKPFGTLANVNRLSAMADEEQAQQQERAAQQVLSQISAQYADNPDGAVEELRRRGFAKQAQALESHILDTKKKTFDIRKVELENERLTGQIAGDAADREIKAMAARSPEEILKLYAGVDTPEEAEIGKGLMRYKFGAKAEPVIALLGEFSPEKSAFAARTVMGPAKMADIENAGLAREQAWDLAKADDTRADAQQAQTTTYQNRMASVAERNAGSNALRARQAGAGGGGGASGGTGSAAIPPQAQSVLARVLTGMPGTRVGLIRQEVSRLAGDEAGLKSYLRYAATQKVGETRQTAMQGRMETLAALKDAEELLQQVPTGFIRGTWENTARVLGKTSDPRLVELGTRMGTILAHYMRSISGAAVSDNEAARLTPLIPNYKNDLSVNLGTIKGFSEAIKSFDKAFYQNTFGENYDWVMGSGQAASSGPKAGDMKPIMAPGYPPGAMAQFVNGKWVRVK